MVPETIEPLVRILKSVGKTLDIAIGFETQDDYLRNKVLRKGMGRAGFADGVRAAKNAGARVSVYVMLMPCDMTEGFALKECEESVRVAFQAGADEVLVQARYSHHDHVKCPTLWTITELLSRVAQLGPVMLGRWETELPTPVVWPKNCPSCTPAVMDAIVQYRNTLSPQCIAPENLPDCECRKDWEEAIKDVSPPQKVDDTKRHLPTV
jgi:radical SAM enzyme (TIGR01210 family)